jgi:hypothetical protein
MPPALCEGSRGVAFLTNGRRRNKARPMPANSQIRTTDQGKRVAQLSVMLTGILPERRARRIRWRCGFHRSRYMGPTPVGADNAGGGA